VTTAYVRLAVAPAGTARGAVARAVWQESLPSTERELAVRGLAFFTYRVAGAPSTGSGHRLRQAQGTASLRELVDAGVLVPVPIVYEDFLPRSAAGIFQSNLTDEGTRDDDLLGTPYDIERLGEVIGRPITDPTQLYAAEQSASLAAAAQQLGLAEITIDWRMHP
jgi:uncharacterized glyoxalase superfamily metalloenzyme YdcJ